jgi:pimeloyl-ACP methyl ester carboxylesterase
MPRIRISGHRIVGFAGRLAALLLALVLTTGPVQAQSSPLWGGLAPGPYAVGFRILYQADPTRPWLATPMPSASAATVRPGRPVRISLWYPARPSRAARAMVYRDYVQLPEPPAEFRALDRALVSRNLATLWQIVRTPAALETLLASRTSAFRDAPPHAGRFPLVVYVSGLNETGQHANSVLCEYLASQGFVVAAIPQVGTTPARLRLGINPVDLETQVRDVEFAAAQVRALPFLQPRWAIAGHSMGGVVALLAQARNPDLAAVVGLDASYGSKELAGNLTASPFFRPDRMRAPLLDLRRGDPPASLAVLDSLRYSNRYLGVFPAIAHGDFTSFPMIAALVPVDIQGRTVEDARQGHELAVRTAATFLKAVLNRDAAALSALSTASGEAGVMRWRAVPAAVPPPTEEEFVGIVETRGVAAAAEAYRRARGLEPDLPLVNERLILGMGYDSLEPGGDPRRAVEIFRFLTEIRPGSADFLDSLAEAYIAAGQVDLAREASRRVLAALDSDATLSAEQKAQLGETARQRIAAPD